MSKATDTSADESPTTTQAKADLCDFLSERSELSVSFEEPDDDRERRYDRLPVARTQAGTRADVSDFPSGKSDEQGNFSKKTYVRYRGTVNDFIQSQDVSDLMEVTPREISRWNQTLQQRDYARTTRDGKLETLRVFIEWAERHWRITYSDGKKKLSDVISKKRDALDVSNDEKSRAGEDDYRISSERAEEIIGHLAKHDYASRQMVEFLLIYHIGCRKSALLSLNCGDIRPQKNIIEIRNRPEQASVRLKKGNSGERDVNIKPKIMSVVMDYIDENRTEPQDGSGALLTSWAGRINESTLYRDIAGLTKCGDCTDDEGEPFTKQNASDCPESIGPHDLRRVAITTMRDKGLSWEVISGRVNAKVEMLKQHYDSPTYEGAAERRKAEVMNAL